MSIVAQHFMKKALLRILSPIIIKIYRLSLQLLKIRQASGFHGKNIIVEEIYRENPDGNVYIIFYMIEASIWVSRKEYYIR